MKEVWAGEGLQSSGRERKINAKGLRSRLRWTEKRSGRERRIKCVRRAKTDHIDISKKNFVPAKKKGNLSA